MAKHKSYTFRPGSLDRFTKKYGIRFYAVQVYAGMICMKQDHPDEKFFILTLRNHEGRLLKIPYKQGSRAKGFPELNPTLEMIAHYAHVYFDYDTAEEYCAAFSIDEWECEKKYEILESLVGRAREFLGEETFDELMKLREGGFEMEGDRGWQRLRTCGQ